MDFTIRSLKVTILIRIFSICLFPSIRIISKRIFFCFLKFHTVCFEKKQKWKNLHELWTAPNLVVACLEFLWIDPMLDYVLQWKGIWYYRYDMACCLQFSEAGSLMGILYRLTLLLWLSTNPLWCFASCFAIKVSFCWGMYVSITPDWSRKFDDNTMYIFLLRFCISF